MLARLAINDVVLIDRLAVELQPGLCAFTGETGAGKSILLDALGLALGGRSEAALVRAGCDQASVSAEFALPAKHPARRLVAAQGLPDDDTLVLRRIVAKDGKSRAFINDQSVSVALLREIGGHLVEIHGQFETYGLLDAATHGELLDAFGNLQKSAGETGMLHATWRQAVADHAQTIEDVARIQAEENFLRAAVAELDQLAPQTGEADHLAASRTTMQHREKIVAALQTAENGLAGDRGAERAISEAARAIAKITDQAGELAKELLATLDRAADEIGEASTLLNRLSAATELDPAALEQAEERLFALRACARKHNVDVDALPQLRDDLAARLDQFEHQGDLLSQLAKKAEAARHAYLQKARALSAKRQAAGKILADRVNKELPALKLERAKLSVQIQELPEDQWRADGIDRIIFLAATNPGTPPGPIHKIASGGELARFMLALKVVLAEVDPIPTLVFDEVDTGIGGATASAVGERLAQLGAHVQVLVVTHSPQVAAKAAHHWRVEKQVKAGKAHTQIIALDHAARREEIARMLAGSELTDAARAAALSLLDDDSVEPPQKLRQQARRK